MAVFLTLWRQPNMREKTMYSTAKIPDDERAISAQHSSNSVLRNQSQTPQQTQRSLTEHNILQLQRAIGNQAVSQLFSGAVVKQTYDAYAELGIIAIMRST
jgi:hypothetical protein